MHLFDTIFNNKHYYAAAILARLLINLGTFLWGTFVITGIGHLDETRFPFYRHMNSVADERIWAGCAMVLVMIGVVRLLCCSEPKWWGGIGYGLMSFFWMYLTLALFIDYPDALPPATAASLIITCATAIYAFVSNPRPRHRCAVPRTL
jgi:hypothetical protein